MSISKLSVLAVSLLAVSVLALSVVATAAGMGQIEGGDIYRVRNVTKSTDFTDPVSATCGETVQFKVRIHNPGPSALQNVTVAATLPGGVATTHVSRVTVSSPFADPNATSDTATVNLDKAGSLAYIAGSTELLDANGGKISALGDTILSSGVTVSSVGVSINEKRFVQFQAKVNCEQVPVNIRVCELATRQIITIREDQFNANLHSRDLSKCASLADITVCELATKKIIVIKEDQFDANKHSRDVTKCAAPGDLVVCEVSTGKVVTIKEDQFDGSKHSKDLSKCVKTPPTGTTPTPATPSALPDTGTGEVLAMFASIVTGGMIAYRLVWLRRMV